MVEFDPNEHSESQKVDGKKSKSQIVLIFEEAKNEEESGLLRVVENTQTQKETVEKGI